MPHKTRVHKINNGGQNKKKNEQKLMKASLAN
jgi:hypothetical protein